METMREAGIGASFQKTFRPGRRPGGAQRGRSPGGKPPFEVGMRLPLAHRAAPEQRIRPLVVPKPPQGAQLGRIAGGWTAGQLRNEEPDIRQKPGCRLAGQAPPQAGRRRKPGRAANPEAPRSHHRTPKTPESGPPSSPAGMRRAPPRWLQTPPSLRTFVRNGFLSRHWRTGSRRMRMPAWIASPPQKDFG